MGQRPNLLLDDQLLGGILLKGNVPPELRKRIRPELFERDRRKLAAAILTVNDRIGICPREAVLEEMGLHGAVVQDLFPLFEIAEDAATPEEFATYLRAIEYRHARQDGAGQDAKPVGTVSLGELMMTTFPSRPAHIGGGILPAEGKLLFTGHGGIGKTVGLLQTALERTAGRAWLGRYLGDGASRVGLLLQEDPLEVTQWRLRQLMRGLRLDEGADLPVFLNRPTRYLNVTRDNDLAWIIQFVKDHGIDLLVPDPLITFHGEDENSNARMRYVCDRFTAVMAETQCAVMLAHHHRRSPEGVDDPDPARGARAIQDWARTVISLTGQQKVEGRDRIRMTFSKLNYGPMPPGALTLERDSDTLLVRVVEESEKCSAETAARILEEHLGGKAESMKAWQAEVEKVTVCSDQTARQAMKKAIKSGWVLEGEQVKTGKPIRIAEGVSFGSGGS